MINDIAFSSYNNSDEIISLRRDGIIRFWNLKKGKAKPTFKVAGNSSSMSLSPDGRYLAVKSVYRFKKATKKPPKVYLFDLKKHRLVYQRDMTDIKNFGLRFSSDGKQVIITTKFGFYFIEIDSIPKK